MTEDCRLIEGEVTYVNMSSLNLPSLYLDEALSFSCINLFCCSVPFSAPENLTGSAIDSTSISLQWNPPPNEELHGILRHYQIDVIEEPTLRYFSVQATASQHQLSSLHPFYTYIISVAASTVDTGPFSGNITIQTDPDSEYRILQSHL